jgi:hypothetical protein
MIMKLMISTLILCTLLCFSCKGQTLNNFSNDNGYLEDKNAFDTDFTNHFPNKIECDSTTRTSNLAPEINKVGFLLYEYDVEQNKFDIINAMAKKKSLAKYDAKDSCLLIVHRFETDEPFDNEPILDSSLLDKTCYGDKYPIPNFLSYAPKSKNTVILDDSFIVYVFEAKNKTNSKKFKMKTFLQMPKAWSNGYSKGMAISEKNRNVIYWSIMW